MISTRNLPDSPISWFYIAKSNDLTTKPKKFKIGNLELIAFRNNHNKLISFQSRCPHMNADLSLGCLVSNKLQCSLHHWEFDNTGKCEYIPNQAKLKSYPIVERDGFVYVFNNEEKIFELPFFDNLNHNDFSSSAVKIINTENEWFVGAANAFDLVHFETVHSRHLLRDPKITKHSDFSYRIQLDYEIKGKRFSDRLMKLFFGKEASLNFTVFAGNFILAETTVKNFKNYMMIITTPIEKNKSNAHLMIYSKKTLNPLKKLKQKVQAELSRKFFQDEADSSQGVFMDIKNLGPSDLMLKNYLHWLIDLYKKN